MKAIPISPILFLVFCAQCFIACENTPPPPSKTLISELNLKYGKLISCGSASQEFGVVDFDMSCDENIKADFNTAMALLHSFEYDEAEKMFSKVIDASPGCALAYWGVAMSAFHPLWEPPLPADLVKGAKAIAIANSLSHLSEKEKRYIQAAAAYFHHWKTTAPPVRSLRFENAMEALHADYPDDREAAILYALALVAAASPTDKLYSKQLKAGKILDSLYKIYPDHPGISHYIIHAYDYPLIAKKGLDAARRYARVAPSSAHAQHMPSHIFVRLGLWDDCIQSNMQSVSSAQCYAQSAGIRGHWDEEMHGLDYLVYAHLQKGNNGAATQLLQYLHTIREVHPANLKVAYAFAAIPARIVLENKNWKAAASLPLMETNFAWSQFPWQEAIVRFARTVGASRSGNVQAAASELEKLKRLQQVLQQQNDTYRSQQVAIQIKGGEAWYIFARGNIAAALRLMKASAEQEDSTAKHPVTPGEVLPARELYADMLLQVQQYRQALQQYELVLQKSPNRFNSLYGAATAAEGAGDNGKAVAYYTQLALQADARADRRELLKARTFINQQS